MRKVMIGCFMSLLLFSCRKNEDNQAVDINENLVLILNEGNFTWANASLSYYDKTTKRVNEKVFQQVNDVKMGDVLQSVTEINGKLYFVMNNSGKIWVCDKSTLKAEAEISGFQSPRYITQVNENYALVSDLYQNELNIVDLENVEISGSISLKGWSNQMYAYNGKVYVSNLDANQIYVINSNLQLNDSIELDAPANSLVGHQEFCWVSSAGKQSAGILPFIEKINLSTLERIKYTFGDYQSIPTNLCLNATANSLYFVAKDVMQMDAYDLSTASVLLPANGKTFYGLGVDPNNNELYLSDAKDYVQQSSIYRLNANGSPIDTFETGIISNGFWFY